MNSLLHWTCARRAILLCVQTTVFCGGGGQKSIPDCELLIGNTEGRVL